MSTSNQQHPKDCPCDRCTGRLPHRCLFCSATDVHRCPGGRLRWRDTGSGLPLAGDVAVAPGLVDANDVHAGNCELIFASEPPGRGQNMILTGLDAEQGAKAQLNDRLRHAELLSKLYAALPELQRAGVRKLEATEHGFVVELEHVEQPEAPEQPDPIRGDDLDTAHVD